jgi:hypothetical protein
MQAIRGIKPMTNRKQQTAGSDENNEGFDLHWEFKLKLSPLAKKAIATFIQAAKIKISIGKILLPLMLAGSIALPHREHPPQPSLPPDSIEQPIQHD